MTAAVGSAPMEHETHARTAAPPLTRERVLTAVLILLGVSGYAPEESDGALAPIGDFDYPALVGALQATADRMAADARPEHGNEDLDGEYSRVLRAGRARSADTDQLEAAVLRERAARLGDQAAHLLHAADGRQEHDGAHAMLLTVTKALADVLAVAPALRADAA